MQQTHDDTFAMPEASNLNIMRDFSRFFTENQERFLLFAYSYVKDRATSEDILMDSVAALWENREKWQENSNLHAVLLTIIKNKTLNYLAHQQVRLRAEEKINNHEQRELNLRISTLEACNPETIFDNEIQQIVQEALNRLPEQSRKIFILSRHEHISNKKIAEQLGISVKSVEFHITKTLKILRHELKDYLFSLLF